MMKHCEECGIFHLIDGFSGVCLWDKRIYYINDECRYPDIGDKENTNKTNTALKKGD